MAESARAEIRRISSRADWTSALDALPGATVFHEWDWLTMMAGALRMRFEPLEVRSDERRLGIVPAMLRSRGPVATLNWVPFPYLGPLAAPEDLGVVLDALQRWQRRHRVAIARLGFSPLAAPDPAVLRAHGYTIEAHHTMSLTLADRPFSEIEHAMQKTTRKKARRAERAGVTIAAAQRDDVSALLPRVIAQAFARRGLHSHYPPEIGVMIWDRYGERADARCAVAMFEGRSIGVLITIADGRRAYLFQGGVLEADRPTYADVLLHLDAIEWGYRAGLGVLDMVGAPEPGIATYKASYGAIPEPFTVAQRVNFRLYQLGQRAHWALVSKLPSRAAGR